ncbi:Wss1p [Sugiyamaella lignohabitans]|uniref:Wss1p n=1 Tax=Sugiyamaella lignohabitans TaxID=796027 RepID=A0A167C8Z9_9ASCO|nr:Wss1p [Sugiyamaella lignohabitans]ANB11374.1 Wss1p [Sugiyamaella lignohabitans]
MVRRAPKPRAAATDKTNSQFPQSSSEFIKTITQLKRKPNNEKALFILHKVASLVKPIMKKHGFKVGTLCEFFPKDPRLLGLNVNHGMKICVRLRPSRNENTFYPLEDAVGTMLHELTHNKYGPHDQKFYKFLDEITTELEGLMASGYSGDGFFGKGNVVGGSGFKPMSINEARKRAVEAVEKRKAMYAGSGQKLGGGDNGPNQKRSMKELILMAAERRARDNKWCASQHIPPTKDLGIESDDGFEILDYSWNDSGSDARDSSRDDSRSVSVDAASSSAEVPGPDQSNLTIGISPQGIEQKSSISPKSGISDTCSNILKRPVEVITLDSDDEDANRPVRKRLRDTPVVIDLTED